MDEQKKDPNMNSILDLAQRIRNEYGQRDGQINNASNPVGNFRAWSQAFDLANRLFNSKQSLLSSGGQLTQEQAQNSVNELDTSPEAFNPEKNVQGTIAEMPENGFLQPAAYIGGNQNRMPGPETLTTTPQDKNFIPDVGRSFANPRIGESVTKYLGG